MAFTESGLTNISNGDGNIHQRKIDTDISFVTYGDGVDTFGRIIDISGGTIDAGPEQTIWDSDYVTWVSAQTISTTQVVLAANDDGTDVEVRTVDISGTVLSENAAGTIESTNGTEIRMAMAGASQGAVFYISAETDNPARVGRFTVAGGTVTTGTPEDLDDTDTSHRVFSACAVDSDRVFIAYRRDTVDNELWVQCIDISAGISKGTAVRVDTNAQVTAGAGATPVYGCELVDTDKVVLVWRDITGGVNDISAILIELSGTTINDQGGKTQVYQGAASTLCHGLTVDNSSTVIVYYTEVFNTDGVSAETLLVTGLGLSSNADATKITTIVSSSDEAMITAVDSNQFIAVISEKTSFDVAASILVGGGLAELRHIAMDSDETNLYVTQSRGGKLQMVSYELADLNNAQSFAIFGNATYAEIDARTYGLFPARVPNNQEKIYLYGRDGNDLQTQYNDLNGTLGWVDVGQGTATWGTAKFAAALMIDPLWPNDVVVAFDDNDIYQTTQGTTNWVKMGDAPTNLRAGMRVTLSNNELLLGGTAPGTIHYTPNWGVSFGVGSDASLGTINWIEESR